MKTPFKLCVVSVLLLFVLTACELFNQINVAWSITSFGWSPSHAHVNYQVWNQGKYDLTGVNLEIGAYLSPLGDYVSAWTTPDFDLAQGELRSGVIDIYIGPSYGALDITGAAVLGVDMDKPGD